MNKLKGLSDRIRLEMEIKELINAATDAAYRDGYEAGKLSGAINIVEDINNKWLEEKKSANYQRARTIAKAKEFISTNLAGQHFFKGGEYVSFSNTNGYVTCHDVEFIVDKEKQTIVALIKYGKIVALKGIAKCMPGDVFNEHIGKAIALAKALKIDIPVEFLEAVQPDELVVGHVTIWSNDFRTTYTVNEIKDNKAYCNNTKEHWRLPLVYQDLCNIIDDTNAQYEVTS